MSNKNLNESNSKKRKQHEMDDFDELDNLCLADMDFSHDDFHLNIDLDLSKWTRCIVEKCERDTKTFDILLCVRENELNLPNKLAELRLQGPWSHTKVSVGDIISCLAVWNDQLKMYSISYDAGFCVVHPDTLISGTSVVGSLFCQRKGVLSDRFTGIDCSNKIMAIGSIVHELFQTVISQQLTTKQQIEKLAEKMINSRQMIYQLYETKMSIDEIKVEFNKFIPNILKFMHRYITGDDNTMENDTFTDKIDTIQDIEENIWLPRLGLKGKVDVSVKIRRRNKFFDSDVELLPMELKTGRASFSSEHRGQLIIYQMMMSENETNPIKSGLLLYLRDGVMKEINGTHSEQRDLIMLRNEVAYFTTKSEQSIKYLDNLKKTFNIPILPDPINHHSACESCPYQTICCTLLSRDFEKLSQINRNHPLHPLIKNVEEQVTSQHIDYFIHWTGILALEEKELCRSDNELKTLWTDTPENREKRQKAITNLVIIDSVLPEDTNSFIHTFKKNHKDDISKKLITEDLTLYGLNVGDYIRVSTNKRVAVAAGRVLEITSTIISLSLERNLKLRYRDQIFILDKNNSQTVIRFNLANLGALLDQTDAANQLRRIIIDRIPSTLNIFKSSFGDVEPILSTLNNEQQFAIKQAINVKEYLLLKGLPGTGKTQTLVAMVQIFITLGKSVLITSHTHSAVDNLLERLGEKKITFLRLGDSSRVAESIKDYCEENVIKNCSSPEELDRIYRSFPVVGVTCLGASHPMLVHRKFDICLVDEATQVFQPTVIRPLLCANKFILVGDPKQLPPIIQSKEAISFGADESLFERLDIKDKSTAMLTLQYRMNSNITSLANRFYDCLLTCATNEVRDATIQIKNRALIDQKFPKEKWLVRPLSTHTDNSVVLLNTGNCFDRSEKFRNSVKKIDLIDSDQRECDGTKIKSRISENYCETGIVLVLLKAFCLGGIDGKEIGVIAPYNSQVDLIKRNIEKCVVDGSSKLDIFKSVEVSTVDRFQGRDKQIIIYSCTKCDNPKIIDQREKSNDSTSATVKAGEILDDIRRLTVAITRSKYKLIIIGDVNSLKAHLPFEKLFASIPSMAKVILNDGLKGFYWEDMLQNLLDKNSLF